jgi:hypothetical protein
MQMFYTIEKTPLQVGDAGILWSRGRPEVKNRGKTYGERLWWAFDTYAELDAFNRALARFLNRQLVMWTTQFEGSKFEAEKMIDRSVRKTLEDN